MARPREGDETQSACADTVSVSRHGVSYGAGREAHTSHALGVATSRLPVQ